MSSAGTTYSYLNIGVQPFYCENSQSVLFFGGIGNYCACGDNWFITNDLWNWDGTTWSRVAVGGTKPGGRGIASLAFDPASSNLLVFGGDTSVFPGGDVYNTFSWNASTNNWTDYGINAPAIKTPSMAFDQKRSKYVMYGCSATTYEWSGSAWTPFVKTPNPGDRGCSPAGNGPGPGMAYDPSHEAIILFGGSSYDDKVWYWKNNEWGTFLTPDVPDKYGNMVYDSLNKVFILHAGDKRTWLLDTGAENRPAITFEVSIGAIGKADHIWKSLEINSYVGGYGYSGANCSKVAGAQLLVWNKRQKYSGAWLNISNNNADVNSPSQDMKLSYATQDAAFIDDIVFGSKSKEVSLAFLPVSKNGCNPAHGKVAVDYAEVTLKYTLAPSLPALPSPTYVVSTAPAASWEDARNACIAVGGDLAVVKSQAENDAIKALLDPSRDYWLGMHSMYSQGELRWVNGVPAWYGDATGYPAGYGFTDWTTGDPDDPAGQRCFGYYASAGLKWVSAPCSWQWHYVCQVPEEGSLYISTTTKGWNDARTQCQSMGKDLLMVKSGYKQYQLEQLLSPIAWYWFGLRDNSTQKEWRWVDGTLAWTGETVGGVKGAPNGYANWHPSQPDYLATGAEHTGLYWGTQNYLWGDDTSTSQYYYACE